MIKIGLLGCGTVGSGVVKLLNKNAELIRLRSGDDIVIKKVLERDPEKCLELGLEPDMITQNWSDIRDDAEIDIVVELIGGIEPAFQFVTEAMKQGKHVVSANKDLIAVRGQELFDTASENGVDFILRPVAGVYRLFIQ